MIHLNLIDAAERLIEVENVAPVNVTSVKELQSKLIQLGYLTGKADGVYGTKTTEAVKAFQKASKLTADGMAGEPTGCFRAS